MLVLPEGIFVVVDLLRIGVIDLVGIGVVDLLKIFGLDLAEVDPERKSGNLERGESGSLSDTFCLSLKENRPCCIESNVGDGERPFPAEDGWVLSVPRTTLFSFS